MPNRREQGLRIVNDNRAAGEPKDEKRNQLIGIAMNVICRYGVRKTTLEDVAKAAGCSTTSLYYYFRNKEQLVREAIGGLIRATLQEMQAAVDAVSNPEEQLVAAWRALALTAKRNGYFLSMDADLSEVIPIANDLLADFDERYAGIIEKVLSRGVSTKVFRVKDVKWTAKVLASAGSALIIKMSAETSSDEIEPWIQKLGRLVVYGVKGT